MKYALIGCGRIAINHIKAVINNQLELVAVCDVLPNKMEELLSKQGLAENKEILRYTDYRQMIAEHPEIQLISIATESGSHAEIALYCIDQGINLIIEKPMAMSIAMSATRVFPDPTSPCKSLFIWMPDLMLS